MNDKTKQGGLLTPTLVRTIGLPLGLILVFCLLVAGGNVNQPTNGLPAFVESVVLIGGHTSWGTAFLLDCKPIAQERISCTLLTARHVMEGIKGQYATIDLRRGRLETLQIRELNMVGGLPNPKQGPIVPKGQLELIVGRRVFSITLTAENNTLEGVRDLLNSMGSATGVMASVEKRGTDQALRYVLQVHPHATINIPEIDISLRQIGSTKNLLVEQSLWFTHPKANIDLALMTIEVPQDVVRRRLTVDDLADSTRLSELETGDAVFCIGYALAQPSTELGYAGVRSATIFSFPFPPAKNTHTFSIDGTISHGQSGGPCVVTSNYRKPDMRASIVGMVISEVAFVQERKWDDGEEKRFRTINVGEILKAPSIRDAVELFRRK